MFIGIGNIIPIIRRPIGGGSPPPVVCKIELEASTDFVELEPAASTDVMIIENCGGTPPTSNVLAQNGVDNLITQNSEPIIQQ